jgi:dolichol-phosphate mannosyltransferase
MDLAIVIPVYNEEENVQVLLEDFYTILTEEGINYTIFIINDGSTDGSIQKLESLARYIPNLELLSKKNSGHGPSLIKGYQLALAHQWIFQFDSDYQYSLSAFRELWRRREEYDLLIAERKERKASWSRHGITMLLTFLASLLYGKGIHDINVPYRLIRATQLRAALSYIHPDSFAPNTLITAYFIKRRLRIFSSISELRQEGIIKQSKLTVGIFKGCLRSIIDLMTFRYKI